MNEDDASAGQVPSAQGRGRTARSALAGRSAGWIAAAFFAGVAVTLAAIVLAGPRVTVLRGASASRPLVNRPVAGNGPLVNWQVVGNGPLVNWQVVGNGPVTARPASRPAGGPFVQVVLPARGQVRAGGPALACVSGPRFVTVHGHGVVARGNWVVVPGHGSVVRARFIVVPGHGDLVHGRQVKVIRIGPGRVSVTKIGRQLVIKGRAKEPLRVLMLPGRQILAAPWTQMVAPGCQVLAPALRPAGTPGKPAATPGNP